MGRMRVGLTLCALLIGCGGDSSTGTTTTSVVGQYRLSTVNGLPLPGLLSQSATSKTEITDDLFTLNADHTYSEQGHLRVTNGATVTTTPGSDVGTYSVSGSQVNMVSTAGFGTSAASIAGNTFTMALSSSVTAVYVKQ